MLSLSFEFTRHKLAYVALLIGMIGLTLVYLAVWPNRWAMRGVSIGLAAFYALWGITTHVKTSHLTQRVIAEYIGVAILGGGLLILITL